MFVCTHNSTVGHLMCRHAVFVFRSAPIIGYFTAGYRPGMCTTVSFKQTSRHRGKSFTFSAAPIYTQPECEWQRCGWGLGRCSGRALGKLHDVHLATGHGAHYHSRTWSHQRTKEKGKHSAEVPPSAGLQAPQQSHKTQKADTRTSPNKHKRGHYTTNTNSPKSTEMQSVVPSFAKAALASATEDTTSCISRHTDCDLLYCRTYLII